MKVLLVVLLSASAIAIDTHAAENLKKKDDTVSIQPNGAEFGDFGDFGSMFNDLLEDDQIGGLLGSLMGGAGGANGLGSLLGSLGDPDQMLKHAEDVLGVNPMELLEKFGDPAMMEDMMAHVSDHELFKHLEAGNFQAVLTKMMDPAYMRRMAEEMHQDPKVKAVVDKVSTDPHVQTIIERVQSGESAEKVQGLVQNIPLAQLVQNFAGGAGGNGLDLMSLMSKFGGEGAMGTIMQQMLQNGGDPSQLLNGDMGKMLGSLMGGDMDIGKLMAGLNGQKAEAPKQAIPDLHKFASLVDTLGGLDKVVAMMKDMGMEDMLEKAGGAQALQAIIDETKNKA